MKKLFFTLSLLTYSSAYADSFYGTIYRYNSAVKEWQSLARDCSVEILKKEQRHYDYKESFIFTLKLNGFDEVESSINKKIKVSTSLPYRNANDGWDTKLWLQGDSGRTEYNLRLMAQESHYDDMIETVLNQELTAVENSGLTIRKRTLFNGYFGGPSEVWSYQCRFEN